MMVLVGVTWDSAEMATEALTVLTIAHLEPGLSLWFCDESNQVVL